MSGFTGGFNQAAMDDFKYVPINSKDGDAPWVVRWTCRQCEKRVSVPRTNDDQDLTCPECGHTIPTEAGPLEKSVEAMSERERHKFFNKVKRILLWRGWDSECRCHAANIGREIGELLSKNGYTSEEYT